MTPFYTRTGDDGYTGLLGEGRWPKEAPRLEALGAIDEATAALGLARAFCQAEVTATLLITIQKDLYHLMAEIAATPENASRFRAINPERVAWLENETEQLSQNVQIPKDFIIPGDTRSQAALSLARTVVRKAERRVAFLVHQGEIDNPALLQYLNRLSSLCFILELYENQIAGKGKPTLAKE